MQSVVRSSIVCCLLVASLHSTLIAQVTDKSTAATLPSESADATQGLQLAINSGGQLQLDARTYVISNTLVVDLSKTGFFSIQGNSQSRIVMRGAGPAVRIIGTHQGTADPASVLPAVWEKQRMPTISQVEIVGEHPESSGIEVEGTMQLTIDRVLVRRVKDAIRLAKRNRNVIISNCHLYENKGIGILLDDVDLHQINVANSHISYNCRGGIVSRGGNVRNLQVTGCDIEANMCSNSPATANILIDCRPSRFGTAEVAITGCTIQHSNVAGSANIRIHGQGAADENSRPGRRWGNVTITGNVLSDVETNLHLDGCRGVTLQGNTFWMGYKQNILLEKCSSIVMATNNLDRNPGYDYGTAKTTLNSVVIRDSADCTIQGLHVTEVDVQPAAVVVERCKRMNISGCSILDCPGVGLLLRDVTDSLVTGCLIQDDGVQRKPAPSFKAVGGSGNQFSGNRFAQGAE